jgi:membrane protein
MQTETHVYAMAISASILLAFFPFLIVMLSLAQHVLKLRAAADAIYFALGDYFPDPFGQYIQRNLRVVVASRGPFQTASVLLLLLTANGIFQPLEVAFNRIWRCNANRSYIKNQLVGVGLVFLCGALVVTSIVLTGLNNQFLKQVTGAAPTVGNFLGLAFFKLAAVPISMLMLFFIYWLLPNCRLAPSQIAPAAIGVGVLLELLKYLNLLTWPYLRVKLYNEYGPFTYAVTLLLWGFVASLIILAGAEWAARQADAPYVPLSPDSRIRLRENQP